MKEISIKRAVILTIVIFAVVQGVMVFSSWMLGNRIQEASGEQQRFMELMLQAKDTRFSVVQIQQFLTDVSATAEPGGYEEAAEHLKKATANLDTMMAGYPEQKESIVRIKAEVESLHAIGTKMAEAYIKEGRQAGNSIMKAPDGFDNASLALAAELDKLVSALNARLTETTQTLHKAEQQGRWLSAGGNLTAFVLIVAIMLLLYRKIVPPLMDLCSLFDEMSRGELTCTIDVRSSNDEIGRLGQSFNRMGSNLCGVISKVLSTSNQVAALSQQLSGVAHQAGKASGQVASAIQEVARGATEQTRTVGKVDASVGSLKEAVDQVARGATEQARSITIITTRIQGLSSSIGQVARGAQGQSQSIAGAVQAVQEVTSGMEEITQGARKVESASVEAQKTANEGAVSVRNATSSMEKIKSVVDSSGRKIRELGDRSQQIGEIIEVIDEIADQTNLLALNAAIEAARAGEHGRGFEVVAEEVRKLAERSSKATKEIAKLINAIQEGTQDAVASMAQVTGEVATGAETARQAGVALGAILEAVEETSSQIEKITSAVDVVSRNSEELSEMMSSISSVTEETRASAEAMSAVGVDVVQLIQQVSSVVETNAAMSKKMAVSGDQVAADTAAITKVTESSAAATEQVSASAEELAASVEEIAASAQSLAESALALQRLAGEFKV